MAPVRSLGEDQSRKTGVVYDCRVLVALVQLRVDPRPIDTR